MRNRGRYIYLGVVLVIAGIALTFSFVGKDLSEDVFSLAEYQAEMMMDEMAVSKDESVDKNADQLISPRTLDDERLRLVSSRDWTSGFFPGVLWYIYEYSKEEDWLKRADEFTWKMEREQWNSTTHDMGFKINCSFGNGYRITHNEPYKDVIIQSAKTLITRFNPKIGCIRSWDHHQDQWQFPVIIDNMMNLELLFLTTKLTGDSVFYKVAVTHAETTLKNHYRDDNSSFHVIDYDTITGEIRKRNTHQGYGDGSAWSRGQAWGLYGYTLCFRETGNEKYLRHAEKIAAYILDHPNMPEDLVPYWDYDAPGIPNEPRDASAAAIIASALYELSMYSEKTAYYQKKADKILESLASDYVSKKGENSGFILDHSTGSKPSGSEVDVPLIYADYYFLEAFLRKESIGKDGKLIR